MLALCFMLSSPYYAENYAGIIDTSLLVDNLKTNPKGFWSYINSKTKVKTEIASLTTSNGDSATTPLQKAELLNLFISVVFLHLKI